MASSSGGLADRASAVSGAVLGSHEDTKSIRLVSFVSGLVVFVGVVVALFSTLSTSQQHVTLEQLFKQATFIATILDLYAGIAIFSTWVWFREHAAQQKLVFAAWISLFILTGNIGTAIYVFHVAHKSAGDLETMLFGDRRFEFQH